MSEARPVLAVDLIVEREGKILLGELTDRWSEGGQYRWGVPGREVQAGDDLNVSARRNLLEETGLIAESSRLVTVCSNFALGNHYVTIGVAVIAEGKPAVTRPDDWVRWSWVTPADLPQGLFPAAEKTLRAYTRDLICPELSP